MYCTFRGDFRSITRHWNINSRTKFLSQFICMKLIGWLKEQLLTYMSGAEIWNRLTLNNLLFLLKITGKFHYIRWVRKKQQNILASNSCGYIPLNALISQGSGNRSLASTSLFCISFLLLGAHPPPFSLQYVLVEQFYTTAVSHQRFRGGNQALRLRLSNPACLSSRKFVYLTLSHQTPSERCRLTDWNMPPFFPLSFTLLTSKLLSHIILTLPNIQIKKLGQGAEGGRYCICLQWWVTKKREWEPVIKHYQQATKKWRFL